MIKMKKENNACRDDIVPFLSEAGQDFPKMGPMGIQKSL